jgi:hypothetical protein
MPRRPRPGPQPVPPDKGPSPPAEIPPDQPGLPEDPKAPPKGDPPHKGPPELVGESPLAAPGLQSGVPGAEASPW